MHLHLNKALRVSKTLISCCIIAAPLSISPVFSTSPACDYIYDATYLSWEDLRSPVVSAEPRAIGEFSNIVVYKDYLIVSEAGEGLHIIDNSNASAPESISFIPVYGAQQFAVVGDILYARSYVDLVAIDISDPTNSVEVGRLEDVFPYDESPNEDFIEGYAWLADKEQGVVTDFTVEERCSSITRTSSSGGGGCSGGSSSSSDSGSQSQRNIGVAGSLASILVVDNYLYAIADYNVKTIDISAPSTPSLVNTLEVNGNLETVYYYQDALYIGSSRAVDILDISDRENPASAGTFSHAWQCDPVVVSDSVAFSTLRSGFSCGGTLNQLDILDVSDITSPTLITSVEMEEPWGLAVEGDYLFVADGQAGLKVLDVSTVDAPTEVNNITEYSARDVIVKEGWGVLMGFDALVQFDYQDINDIQIISELRE